MTIRCLIALLTPLVLTQPKAVAQSAVTDGLIDTVYASSSLVIVNRRPNGPTPSFITLTINKNTKISIDGIDGNIGALSLGDKISADFDTSNVASKIDVVSKSGRFRREYEEKRNVKRRKKKIV